MSGCTSIHADLTPGEPAACGRSRRRASASATVEAVINNAGVGQSSIRPDAEVRHPGIAELTPEIYDRFFGVFVRAPATLVRAALPHDEGRAASAASSTTPRAT